MREYIRNITKTNDLILNGTLGNGEIDRFSKADYRWADNKRKSFQTRKIKKGEIYQFEFGKNFVPEMSYEHRGLVIGVNKKLDLCQYLGHKKLNFSSLPNRQGDIVLSCKSLILNLLWCLVSKGTVTPFSVVK